MGFLATLVGGHIVGILGSLISGVMSAWERKQQLEERKLDYAHEISLQEMNIAARSA